MVIIVNICYLDEIQPHLMSGGLTISHPSSDVEFLNIPPYARPQLECEPL